MAFFCLNGGLLKIQLTQHVHIASLKLIYAMLWLPLCLQILLILITDWIKDLKLIISCRPPWWLHPY